MDAVRGILDGHIVLSRDLAAKNHYPAIDVPASISRLMPYLVESNHLLHASKIKEYISLYRSVEELLKVGAYVRGESPQIDEAINKIQLVDEFLKQGIFDKVEFSHIKEQMEQIISQGAVGKL